MIFQVSTQPRRADHLQQSDRNQLQSNRRIQVVLGIDRPEAHYVLRFWYVNRLIEVMKINDYQNSSLPTVWWDESDGHFESIWQAGSQVD